MDVIEIEKGGIPVSRIVFGREISEISESHAFHSRSYLIYDANAVKYADAVVSAIGNCAGSLRLDDVSEKNKTFSVVQDICIWLMNEGADRNSMLVAVGGGIVSDLVGFAASIYKRGVRCCYIPTTLLSQIDASIGGKTGVNMLGYKNMAGTFYQPEFIYICDEVLHSLSARVFRDGLAELLKIFIVEDKGRFDEFAELSKMIMNDYQEFMNGVNKSLADGFHRLVVAGAAVKAGIVSKDEFEKGERIKLNLGHTFAHAIEWCSSSCPCRISHGEAVAIGIALAARLSVRLGFTDSGTEEQILRALEGCGLPVECPFSLNDLKAAMSKDKKADGDRIRFLLIRSVGDVIEYPMTVDEVVDALQS